MDQATAKQLIDNTDYLDNQILVYKEKSKTIFGKIIWKGYSAAAKDEEGNDGTVRVRIKDLYNRNEFSESLSNIATLFPKEFITNWINSKKEILNVLNNNKEVESKTLSWIDQNENLPASAKKIINKLEVCIPLAGNIDKDSELNRIEREITRLENEISLLSKKIGNDNFVSKAPAQIVDSERKKLSKARNDHKSMLEQKNQLLSI